MKLYTPYGFARVVISLAAFLINGKGNGASSHLPRALSLSAAMVPMEIARLPHHRSRQLEPASRATAGIAIVGKASPDFRERSGMVGAQRRNISHFTRTNKESRFQTCGERSTPPHYSTAPSSPLPRRHMARATSKRARASPVGHFPGVVSLAWRTAAPVLANGPRLTDHPGSRGTGNGCGGTRACDPVRRSHGERSLPRSHQCHDT